LPRGHFSRLGASPSGKSPPERPNVAEGLTSPGPTATITDMSFKSVLKSIVFLAILFVMLYLGFYNRQKIDFSFPVAQQEKVTAPAAFIYFAVFAVGVLAGTVLAAGGGKSRGSSGGKSGSK